MAKHPGGRPTTYNQETADKICEYIASYGYSLRKVCEQEGMPNASTIFEWLRAHEEFSKHYVRATEERTEAQNEALLELGDEAIQLAQNVDPKASGAVVQAVKLKSDNIRWSMSKFKPKKFGDHIDMTTNGRDLPSPILGGVTVEKSSHDINEK